ncbi:MAG TPA: hypothetical protein VI231_22420 [Candidatus Binatia bacterium]|jgi:hypothetical protein
MVGSVVGFIVTSAMGTPVLGILYQVAGYAVGFAASDPCKKNGTTTQTAKSAESDANTHASIASAKITEEELQ